jgi:NAD(P)H-flavin reductase
VSRAVHETSSQSTSFALEALIPHPAIIRSVVGETPGVATLWLEFEEHQIQDAYRLAPGQFNMVYVPGVGEVPISVSGLPGDGPGIGHTIRFVGRVTDVIRTLHPGGVLGMRGPYGAGWPMEKAKGLDVLVVAGGLGLAPLKLVVKNLLAERDQFGRLILLYGAREPSDLLYHAEYPTWERRGMEVQVTVDRADATWSGRVGVVPMLLRRLRLEPERTLMMTCGPEIMMRYSAAEGIAHQIAEQDIYLSQERNMHCAIGLCGHCQLGPEFVCKDGPVFPYPKIARFFNVANF